MLVSGPAFRLGRYGIACGAKVAVWQGASWPTVTSMAVDNPWANLYRSHTYAVPTGNTAASTSDDIPRIAMFALKLGRGIEVGPAEEAGSMARGVRHNFRLSQGGAKRYTDMMLAKLSSQNYRTELPVPNLGNVAPEPLVTDVRKALAALVTESVMESDNDSQWRCLCAVQVGKPP